MEMGNAARELCRFCLKIIADQNFDIIGDMTLEMLNVLSIEMDLDMDGKFLMCGSCQDAIERCFNFKSTSLYFETTIAEYISEGSKLDLEEIYVKQGYQQSSEGIPKGHKICRLCMKITQTDKSLNSMEELAALTNDKLQKCFPELNLNAVKHSVICEACLMELQNCYEFIAGCVDVEKKISKYCEARGVDKRQVQLYNVLQFIMNEDSDISECVVPINTVKSDEERSNIIDHYTEFNSIEFAIKTEKFKVESEDDSKSCNSKSIKVNSETGLFNVGQVYCPGADQFRINEEINCDKKGYDIDTKDNQEILYLPMMVKVENADDSHSQFSTKDNCQEGGVADISIKNEEIEIKSGDRNMGDTMDYESQDNTLLHIKSSKRKHNEARQIKNKAFCCEICSTNCSSKYILARHKLFFHVEGPQVSVYECDQCSFKSRYKESLANHRKVHNSIFESEVYECKECQFKTKYKRNLKAHHLARHQDSEVLNKRIQTHKSNSKVHIYSCSLCPYKTKFKRHLHYHGMTHKDKSEMATYDCFHCSYKAKRKTHLRRHMVTHKSPHEPVPYKCNVCDFVTKDKSCLSSHLFVHEDQPKTRLYYCDKCTFTTRYKSSLNKHMFTHPEVNKAPLATHKCTHCPYQSRDRYHFKMHLHIHNDKSLGELPVLKCMLCSYQTINKQYLVPHLQSHRSGSGVELWKCKICGGEYNKFHVKRHQRSCARKEDRELDICSEERINKESA